MALGGEPRRECLSYVSGYSVKAQRTGNPPSYQEPNSQSLQKTYRRGRGNPAYLEHIRDTMQKPVEGVSRSAENVEDRSLFAETKRNSMLKTDNLGNPVYL